MFDSRDKLSALLVITGSNVAGQLLMVAYVLSFTTRFFLQIYSDSGMKHGAVQLRRQKDERDLPKPAGKVNINCLVSPGPCLCGISFTETKTFLYQPKLHNYQLHYCGHA
ncbi:uncharacterized protein PHALS_04037 [Plasmopara halstedii]|uniref:Uncharacterized protein n=1 Tax=Plasmopara halstedii TaxID=4781 RepID=A0A0P1B0Y8_PLAHL|nr:uncharacterized protein PHALS_04037 [Plasmopara halstedii]CEG47341.1 hypothetical protein PHALS_04037 [Plasmopara halstedii]|eukprot:XP_024583710.1 hypothetical protein PHALS_04037 [Plasmopara halstedii]